MAQKDVGNKIPIYKLKTTEEVMKYYDEWGKNNKYDKDMVDWAYSGPEETVNVFKKHSKNKDIKILDAGCGTGLVGIQLKKNGYLNIDGVDLSSKLLELVPPNYYKKLIQIDLNKSLKIKDNSYDAILCVGTFTYGHVKPNALDEFIRISKNKALICFTINEGIYEKYGFDKKIKNLENNNAWKIKDFFKSNYIASKDVNAWLGIAEVIK